MVAVVVSMKMGTSLTASFRVRVRRVLEWLAPGYDVGVAEMERLLADLHGACGDLCCHPR